MKVFHCQHCGQMVYFANIRCERCGHLLGYLPDLELLSALFPLREDRWQPLAAPTRTARFCANATHDTCNWLIPVESPDAYCRACRLNRTIPDLDPTSIPWRTGCAGSAWKPPSTVLFMVS